MVRIRRADWDEECLALLQQDGDLHGSDPSPWDAHETWRADDGPQLVAVAACRPDRQDPTACFLSTCFVAPAARGHGLQKRMIRARVRYARRAGFQWAWTYTAVFSLASMRSLIACGFRPTRRRYIAGYLCWELPLVPQAP